MDKKETLSLTIVGIVLIFVISIVIFKFFGSIVLSGTLCLLPCYTIVLTILFFTFGKRTEKKLIGNQIRFIVDQLFSFYYILIDNEETPYNIDIPPDVNTDDLDISNSNKKLIKNTLIIVFSMALVFFLVSIILWGSNNKKGKIKNTYNSLNYLKFIVLKNCVILVFVILIQLLFYNFIIGEYRPADITSIASYILSQI
jgi:hypothetical protein